MFGVKHNECVGFESKWKVTRVFSETSSQTDIISKSDNEAGTILKQSIEIQSDEPVIDHNTEVDVIKLASFLERQYPFVRRQLDDVNNSKAFDGYKLDENTEGASCKILQCVDIRDHSDKIFRISEICWNQTGNYLALFNCYEHTTWCYHTGIVLIYMLSRYDKIGDSPSMNFSTESCVTNLEFHPTRPPILAGATFTGSIIIWNIHNDNRRPLVTVSNTHDYPINHLQWIRDTDGGTESLLATSSSDSFLKLWFFRESNPLLKLKSQYKIRTPIFAENDSEKTASSKNLITDTGLVCFDFSKQNPDMFIAGLEGGYVLQSSILTNNELKGNSKEEPSYCPECKYYERHTGEVISIQFSPNRQEMFLTCGSDAEIRIYLIGQDQPAQIIFSKQTLFNAAFVPRQELMVISCSASGLPEIFNVTSGKPVKTQASEDNKKYQVVTFALHSRRSDMVALGTSSGKLLLWNVPWRLLSKLTL